MPGDAKAQMNISGSYFDCAPLTETSPAQSVHRLRPTDIKVVGALGNSLSAGFAIQATLETFQNFTEDRGLAWSAGTSFLVAFRVIGWAGVELLWKFDMAIGPAGSL